MYGDEVGKDQVCMQGDNLRPHKTGKFSFNQHDFYVCSKRCKESIINFYNEDAYAQDAYTGDTIIKSNAIIGLKLRGESDVIYFKNKQNLLGYYKNN